jgi:hypothetical protein
MTGRFRKFHISDVKERAYKLDIIWLKDESLEDADDLPEPEALAAEAITELEAAVDGPARSVSYDRGQWKGVGMSKCGAVPLAALVEHSLGGDWGKDATEEVEGYVAVKVVRGTDFTKWKLHRAKEAADRRIKIASLEKRRLREGDLVVEVSGGGPTQPVGRVVRIDRPTLDGSALPLVCSNFFRLLRLKPSVDPRYVERYLRLEYLRGKLDEFSKPDDQSKESSI